MARRVKFRGNYKGIGKMLVSPQMQREMGNRGHRLKGVCVATSPEDTGSYKESFRVEVGIREGKKPRAQAKLINFNDAATYIEWGTQRTPRHRVMGRAAGSA